MKILTIKVKNRHEVNDWMCANIGPSGVRWWIDEGITEYDTDNDWANNRTRLFTDLTPEEEDQVTMIAMMWAE